MVFACDLEVTIYRINFSSFGKYILRTSYMSDIVPVLRKETILQKFWTFRYNPVIGDSKQNKKLIL